MRRVISKPSDYRFSRAGNWRLVTLPDQWSGELQSRVIEMVRAEARTRHPSTVEITSKIDGGDRHLYLKIFHRPKGIPALKDLTRQSKALHFWRQSVLLAENGFNVPPVVAAGEQRRFRVVWRAFVVTEKVDGQAIPVFLSARAACGPERKIMALKRDGLKRFAELVRRFHQCGFVHGDLVASNILVSETALDGLKLYFMDNDRTRRYPFWFPQSLWKRNLVQLNRMPLPGISLQDRMRFLHAYLDKRKFSSADRRLAQWLEVKTRRRRKECDGVDPSVNFRRLMRWLPEPQRR